LPDSLRRLHQKRRQRCQFPRLRSSEGSALSLLPPPIDPHTFIVYQATPRDPLVLGGVVLAMSLLGLPATWIPAQRALSVNPLILLREE